MSSLLRRSFTIRPSSSLLTPKHLCWGRASSSSSSSIWIERERPGPSEIERPDSWYHHESGVRYEPALRESVNLVLSPYLDSSIKYAAKLTTKLSKEESLSPGIPFVILNKHCEKKIILKRDFYEESIQVEVDIVDDEDSQLMKRFSYDRFDGISLIVTIVNEEQSSLLELNCTASPDNSIIVNNVVMKSPDKCFNQNGYISQFSSALGNNMRKDVLEFLARRGIDGSLVSFLHDYMFDKSIEHLLLWQENLKAAVDN